MSSNVITKTKSFVADHKTEVIVASVSIVIIAGVVVCARCHVKDLSRLNYAKDIRINNLEKVIKARDLRIDELESLCKRKDDVFKAVISDSLKHGSSEAGRQMAGRKAYLHQVAS